MMRGTPSRYEPPEGKVRRVLADLPVTVGPFFWVVLGVVAERLIFGGGAATILRSIAALFYRRHLATIAPAFEASFYLLQFPEEARRRRIARAPLLHYAMIGWQQEKSPAASFDPGFVWRAYPEQRIAVDPFYRLLQGGLPSNAASNENAGLRVNEAHAGDRTSVLVFNHSRGGGSTFFLDLYEARIRQAGQRVIRLRAVKDAPALAIADDMTAGAVVFDLSDNLDTLVEYAGRNRVSRILVNHVIDRPPEIFDKLKVLAQRLECSYDYILHDYFPICPRVDLVDGQGSFCNVPPVGTCVRCIEGHGSEVRDVDPSIWRRNFVDFLDGAGSVLAPSGDVARRMAPYLPDRPIEVWEPQDDGVLPAEIEPHLVADEPLRVVVLGALRFSKGAGVLLALARAARSSEARIKFTVIGSSAQAYRLQRLGVDIAGPYSAGSLDRLLDEAKPHVMFFPSIWPETWSFVLTEGLARGLPVVAFDIGAPAERLRRLGRGRLLDLGLAKCPGDLLSVFLELRSQWLGK